MGEQFETQLFRTPTGSDGNPKMFTTDGYQNRG